MVEQGEPGGLIGHQTATIEEKNDPLALAGLKIFDGELETASGGSPVDVFVVVVERVVAKAFKVILQPDAPGATDPHQAEAIGAGENRVLGELLHIRIDVELAVLRIDEKPLPETEQAADAEVDLIQLEAAAAAGFELVVNGRATAGAEPEDKLFGRGLEFLRDIVANPAGAGARAEVTDVERDAVVFLEGDDAGRFTLEGEGSGAGQRQEIKEGDGGNCEIDDENDRQEAGIGEENEREDARDSDRNKQRGMWIDALPPSQDEQGGRHEDDQQSGNADKRRAVVLEELEEPGGHGNRGQSPKFLAKIRNQRSIIRGCSTGRDFQAEHLWLAGGRGEPGAPVGPRKLIVAASHFGPEEVRLSRMEAIIPFVLVGGVLAAVAAVMYYAHMAEKKRIEELRKAAEELSFDFEPKGDAALMGALRSFNLFSQGHSRALTNLLRGRTQDLEVAIFDYRYVTGSGKHRHTWNHSVVCFRFVGTVLPAFSLRPEHMGHKIGQWFGSQDIDFDSHPTFSRKYLLRGSNEAAIRGAFNEKVLDYYEGKSGLCTEGAGNALLFYREGTRVRPEGVRALMEEGFEVLGLFHPMGQ